MAAKRKAQGKSRAGKAKSKKPKPAARKAVVKRPAQKSAKPAGFVIKTDPALEARLRMLGTKMGKSLEAVIVQALAEFVDNWEDHMQTVAALRDTEDRVHLSVPKE